MPFDRAGGDFGPAFTASALPQWAFEPETLQIMAVNQAAIEHYGYPRDELLARTVLQLHPPEEQDAARLHVSGAAAGIAIDSRIWRHITAWGELPVRIALCDVTTPAGRARMAQMLDVTAQLREQRACEDALTRETEALARAAAISRSKDAIVATLGHEMRQPLTSCLPAIAVMEQRISREVGGRAREVIKRQVGALTRLVDDLLDAARMQEGKITLQRDTHDLRRLVEEIVTAQFADVSAHELVLDISLPSTAVWVSIDGARFHQILSNLLSNAIRHSDAGGRVWVQVKVVGGTARLEVRDEGHGIEANVLPHIFDPFAQSAPGANSALGIGLSVVRGLVELHGGKVTAASDGPDHGAAFVVTLPISAPPVLPVKTFASDLRSVAELIRVRASDGADPLDGALEGIETALLIADDQSRVLNANRAALALTGYSEEDLASLHVPDVLAMNPMHAEEYWRPFAVEGRQEGILVLLRKDGARVPVRYCAIKDVRPGLHLSALDTL
jgi:PAS domain S-box-containing protein